MKKVLRFIAARSCAARSFGSRLCAPGFLRALGVAAVCAAMPSALCDAATAYPLSSGHTLTVEDAGPGAVRVRVVPKGVTPGRNYFYLEGKTPAPADNSARWSFDGDTGTLTFFDAAGKQIFAETDRMLEENVDGTWTVVQSFEMPESEVQVGLGQFQDGNLDVKGLTRRLTQVNTQIAMPMIISNRGYGILWNNNGMTMFNPSTDVVNLFPDDESGEATMVDVTGTDGAHRESRSERRFTAEVDLPSDGEYAFLLNVGRTMGRKHYVAVDGRPIIDAASRWLPPTSAAKTRLTAGRHLVEVVGDKDDNPTVGWRLVDSTTTFASPVSEGIDYTVFFGTPDEIIAAMRRLTGEVPMLPKWALGYVHCRERYATQAELLENATEFRRRNIPIDMIVQDWQYWGHHGWNAMQFDESIYPDPKAMTDSIHSLGMKLMLSVWAKVGKDTEAGADFAARDCYIDDTDWIDFFDPEAAEIYWQKYRKNLIPTGIDAWWQDATEPENDDLRGRLVGHRTMSGDLYRNVYPIVVNDRVWRGLNEVHPDRRPLILTRSGAPGIQRYGVFTWSGDVDNDWATLQRQITGGLGQMACGLPWWTYDGGGFFRPDDQHTNADYKHRMMRWIQTAVYLPMMRVHGFGSRTEPWLFGDETEALFREAIAQRYRLVPYLYSEARRVSAENSTLMRPLIFDFPDDEIAAAHPTQFMLGRNLLVCPILEPDITETTVYLPATEGGWYDLYTNERYMEAGYTRVPVAADHVPVFVRAGSILPWADEPVASTADLPALDGMTVRIYPGADGEFTVYDDAGDGYAYRDGDFRLSRLRWRDADMELISSDHTLRIKPQLIAK